MRFGDSADDSGRHLETDSTGHLYLAGDFQGYLDLCGEELATHGDSDIFLAKFTSEGEQASVAVRPRASSMEGRLRLPSPPKSDSSEFHG